jgi:Mrp family chromosome partitioning ATPase
MSQTSSERWADGPTIVQSIWRFRWLVLTVAIVAGVAGYFISAAQPPVYQAASTMYLANPATSGVFQQQPWMNLERYLPQQMQRIRSTRVLTAAAEELDDGTTPRDIAARLEVRGDAELATLSVVISDGSAQRAADLANAVAAAYQEDVRTSQLQRVERAVTELEASAAEIEAQIDTLLAETAANQQAAGGGVDTQLTNQIGVLTQRLVEIEALGQQLLVDARVFGSGVEFVEEAEPPTVPVSPAPRRTAAATAVLAGLLASAFAYWRAGHGRRIASREEPAQMLDAPLLGVLPTYKPPQQVTLAQRTTLEPRTAEAYRFVYSSLSATMRALAATSVMVTSAGPGIGKSETALQVAVTAARRGQSVLLIDADLRMRGLTRFLRADRAPGLLDLAEPHDELHSDSYVRRYPIDQQRHLDVLTAGRMTGSDEDGQLSESWFGAAFDNVVSGYDLVVVDSPPLLAVADTTTIAGYTDAIVLVVREGSDLDDLDRVRQRLRFVQQHLVGYVYLTPAALSDTAFDYGLVRSQGTWGALDEPARTKGKEPSSSSWLRWQEADVQPPASERGGTVRKIQDPSGRTEHREPRS